MCTVESVMEELTAPFPENQVKWIPAATNQDKTKALAVPYVDPRDVAERFDQVLGPLGWAVDHKEVGDQTITGIGIQSPESGEWIWKWDVGYASSDRGEEIGIKGTLSDGIKRAGILWGVGRYLRRVEGKWVQYNAQYKRLVEIPSLPAWALPGGKADLRATDRHTPHTPVDQDMAQDTPDADPEGPPPAQQAAAPSNGNGNGSRTGQDATTQFWFTARKIQMDREDAMRIVTECENDFERALDVLKGQHMPPETDKLPI